MLPASSCMLLYTKQLSCIYSTTYRNIKHHIAGKLICNILQLAAFRVNLKIYIHISYFDWNYMVCISNFGVHVWNNSSPRRNSFDLQLSFCFAILEELSQRETLFLRTSYFILILRKLSNKKNKLLVISQ